MTSIAPVVTDNKTFLTSNRLVLTVRELYIQPIVNKTRKRRRKRRVKKVKDVSEWGAPEWRALLQGKEFTDDDDGIRRVITDVVFSHEDDVYYARYVIKGAGKGYKEKP